MRIGAHVSVAGGLARAVGNARAVGCEAFQVFVSNSRGWAPPRLEREADDRFRAAVAAAGLGPLFVHAPYLVNFASAGPTTLERSREVVAADLMRAQLDRLLSVASLPNVTLSIVPLGEASIPFLHPFVIWELKAEALVTAETYSVELTVQDPVDVDRYREVWERASAGAQEPSWLARMASEL